MWKRRRLWPVFPCVLCVVLTLAVVCQRIELAQTQRELLQIRQQQEEAQEALLRQLTLELGMREGETVEVGVPAAVEIDEEELRQIQRSVLDLPHLLHAGQAP